MMIAQIGDIVERLPSRIVQVVSYRERPSGMNARVVLCADGSVWETEELGWYCAEPPHDPQPTTDWQARAIEAGAALARANAWREEAEDGVQLWRKAAYAADAREADLRLQLDAARAEVAQLKRGAR